MAMGCRTARKAAVGGFFSGAGSVSPSDRASQSEAADSALTAPSFSSSAIVEAGIMGCGTTAAGAGTFFFFFLRLRFGGVYPMSSCRSPVGALR